MGTVKMNLSIIYAKLNNIHTGTQNGGRSLILGHKSSVCVTAAPNIALKLELVSSIHEPKTEPENFPGSRPKK